MKYFIILSLITLPNCWVKSQQLPHQLDVRIGTSYIEKDNLGITYTLSQEQIGLNVGHFVLRSTDEKNSTLNVGGSFYHHFAGRSKYSSLKTWYWKTGVIFLDEAVTSRYSFKVKHYKSGAAKFYFGRDFDINKKMGFTIAAGPFMRHYFSHNFEDLTALKNKISAGFDFAMYYRLLSPEGNNEGGNVTDRFDVNVGVSVTEFNNCGVRYWVNQSAFGVNVGSYYRNPALSASYYLHLLGKSRFTEIKPWFFKAGVTYADFPPPYVGVGVFSVHQKMLTPKLNVGRNINFNERFGMMISAGPFFRHYFHPTAEGKGKLTILPNSDFFFPAGIDLSLFYRP
jgi:hypothetical protein